MKNLILILIGLIFCLQNSCLKETQSINSQENNSNIVVINQNNNSKINQVESDTNQYRKDSDETVYVSILRHIVYHRNSEENWGGDLFDEFGMSILFVRLETISPDDSTILDNLPNISDETIKDFRKTNETTSFTGGLSIKYDARIIEGDRSLEKLFIKAEKESENDLIRLTRIYKDGQKRIMALVGMSKIGFNHDGTQALVYIEYYSRAKGLRKLYVLIPVQKDNSKIRINTDEMIAIPVK
jgi:hypothetical protein